VPEQLAYDIELGGKQYRILWEELSLKLPGKAGVVVFLMPEGKMVWDASGIADDREKMMLDALTFIQNIAK
jgi:hypothetical protein